MSEEKSKPPLNSQQHIRRQLLTAVVYSPPVILGTMMVGPRHALGAWGQIKTCQINPNAAGAPVAPITITISSGANACCPCVPNATKFNANKCAKTQCIKSCAGNAAACAAAGGVGNIKCKDFCKEGPPGCIPPPGCKKPCKCTFDPKKNKNKCK